MIKTFLLLCLLAIMASCQSASKKEMDVPSLPEVDVYADYPMKQMDIGELAEVAYLPFHKKLLFEGHPYHSTFTGCVSERYIISYTFDGDVEVFDHSGKKLHAFNYRGQLEDGKYIGIQDIWLDEVNDEVWIWDYDNTFKIYTLKGTYKRMFKAPESMNVREFKGWSTDSLLCYDDYRVEEGLNKNPHPFYLLSKKDGGIRKLTSVRVFNRINNDERFVLNLGGLRQVMNFTLTTSSLQMGGGRVVLADYAKDTVFCFEQGKVSPLFVRKPSVFASLPFVLTSVDFMTSRYLFFSFAEKSRGKEIFNRSLLFDFRTQEVCRYEWKNTDFEPSLPVKVYVGKNDYPSDWLVNEMTIDKFQQYYKEGKLSGKAVEAARKIKDTDTVVLIFYRFYKEE
jgi:hypothetical protein